MSLGSNGSFESMDYDNNDYNEISHYNRQLKNFHTDQYITKFILRNMNEYPEHRFMEILEGLIEKAYKNSRENCQEPAIFQMILDGTGLETPISIPAGSREQNSVEMILNEIDKLEVLQN